MLLAGALGLLGLRLDEVAGPVRIAGDPAVPVAIDYLPDLEPWLWLLPIGLGLLAGTVPAWQAYGASSTGSRPERRHGHDRVRA